MMAGKYQIHDTSRHRGSMLKLCNNNSPLVFISSWKRFHGFVQVFRAFLKVSDLALLYYRRSWKCSQ